MISRQKETKKKTGIKFPHLSNTAPSVSNLNGSARILYNEFINFLNLYSFFIRFFTHSRAACDTPLFGKFHQIALSSPCSARRRKPLSRVRPAPSRCRKRSRPASVVPAQERTRYAGLSCYTEQHTSQTEPVKLTGAEDFDPLLLFRL